jgi:hypothetical protein
VCPDGAGIVIDGERRTFIGPTWLFHDGKKIAVN